MRMDAGPLERRFAEALEAFVAEVKTDRAVLAAILCGSLSHDRVWEKSDIDVVLVTRDGDKFERNGYALDVKGVNLHACLMPRAEFRRTVEGALRHSFVHSFLARGRLLYSHDPSLVEWCAGLREWGGRDAKVQLLRAGIQVLVAIDKARKWFVTRRDLKYSALWLLYAATPLAQIEMIEAGQLVDREVLPRALERNPEFFRRVYSNLLEGKTTEPDLRAALDAVDAYLIAREDRLFGHILDYLEESGETRSCTDIEEHYERHLDTKGVTTVCEYLASRGRIGRGSSPVRLTRQSRVSLQELAFFHSSVRTSGEAGGNGRP